MKECNTCHRKLPRTEFYKRSSSKDGLQNHCKDCSRIQQAEWRRTNPQRAKEIVRKSHTPERVEQYNANRRAGHRWAHLRRRYGLSEADYNRMYEEQNGQCLLCLEEQEILYVDHCHEEGDVRGLLCDRCNRGLGLLRDDPAIVERALAYLQRAKF